MRRGLNLELQVTSVDRVVFERGIKKLSAEKYIKEDLECSLDIEQKLFVETILVNRKLKQAGNSPSRAPLKVQKCTPGTWF